MGNKTKNLSMQNIQDGICYCITKPLYLFAPNMLKSILFEMKNLSKSDFAQVYYNKLVEKKHLKNFAPKGILIKNTSLKLIEGGYNPTTNEITFSNNLLTLPKAYQVGFIEHELLHFEQAHLIIRTFGIDRYIQALETNMINTLSNDDKYKNLHYTELLELAKTQINPEEIKLAFAKSINSPKINPKSRLGLKAKKYLIATENYINIDKPHFDKKSKEYLDNKLEQEAYKHQQISILWTFILETLKCA